MKRRPLLLSLLAAALPVAAAQKKSLADPLLLGVEQTLFDAGLASAFQKAFGRDTGVAVKLVPGTSATVLASLEQGDVDASMTMAPEIESRLEKQGLAHDRHVVARGEVVLVGPIEGKGKKATDPAGLLGERDIVAALQKLSQSGKVFIAPTAGTGANLSEIALWRAARIAPTAPWYLKAPPGTEPLSLATSEGAYTLVDRGLWARRPQKGVGIVVDGDPRMATEVVLLRSFRVNHPAAKLFGQWVSGPNGRRVAGSLSGWRAA